MSGKDLLRDIHILDLKILKLQKEMQTNIAGNKSDLKSDLTQVAEITTSASAARKKEGQDLQHRLFKVKSTVQTFCNEVKNVKPTPDFVEKVKHMMEGIEVLITEFKEDQRTCYEELLRSEVALWQECVVLEKKLDSWSLPSAGEGESDGPSNNPSAGSRRPPLSSERDVTQNLPIEVADFERFMDQTGGQRGGWSDEDHQAFLRIRQRYAYRIQLEENSRKTLHNPSSLHDTTATTLSTLADLRPEVVEYAPSGSVRTAMDEFLQEAARLIIGKTLERVREHETWHREYLYLLQKKKEAIKRWKERKKNERQRNVGDGDSDAEGDDLARHAAKRSDTEQAEWERRRREMESKRAAVDAWRAQKAIEQYRTKEEEAERVRLLGEAQEEEKKKQQEARKKQVALFKEEKERRERILWLEEAEVQKREKNSLQNHLECHSARIQERNERMLSSRVERKKAQEESELQRQERLQKLKASVQVNVERDASRLLQPTAVYKERVAATEAESHRSIGPILACHQAIQHVSHRAVPAWRKNN